MSTSTPVFSFGQVQEPSPFSNTNTNNHNSNSNTTTTPSFPSFTTSFSSPYQPQYRPKISSPLSSSPIRPFDSMSRSSPPGSPTSKPRGIFGGQSQSQSSPIFGSFLQSQGQGQGQGQGEASGQNGQAAADGQQEQGQNNKFLKYNSRPARPMNHPSFSSNRKEDRRRLFLQNVRQRADDKAWERRGGENEVRFVFPLSLLTPLAFCPFENLPPHPHTVHPVRLFMLNNRSKTAPKTRMAPLQPRTPPSKRSLRPSQSLQLQPSIPHRLLIRTRNRRARPAPSKVQSPAAVSRRAVGRSTAARDRTGRTRKISRYG